MGSSFCGSVGGTEEVAKQLTGPPYADMLASCLPLSVRVGFSPTAFQNSVTPDLVILAPSFPKRAEMR